MTISVAAPPIEDARTHTRALVGINNLSKTFSRNGYKTKVLKDLDLHIDEGEFLVLLGPSGCGKTTLLRSLSGLERPDDGTVHLRDTCVVDGARNYHVPPNRRDVSMVFQNYALWPHMTVTRNVAYPLQARKLKDALRNGRVEDTLKLVQCQHLANRYPPELSGGQQQRISLARALAPRPSLLLLDEPLSNLDVLLRVELRTQLRLLHRQLGFTAVYVTHDQEEALALGSRVAIMREGTFEQIGSPPEVYEYPSTEYVADFLGARNKLTMSVADQRVQIDNHQIEPPHPNLTAGKYAIRMRNTSMRVRPMGGQSDYETDILWLPGGTLLEIIPGTDRDEYILEREGSRFVAALKRGQVNIKPGESIDVGINLRETHCYLNDQRQNVFDVAKSDSR